MALSEGQRNFRSHYYEKVGFRGVEEKKSLDILLAERPVDLARVQNFCLRFPLPSIYRLQVWQLCLGVLPRHTTSTEWVWKQREGQYWDSERALTLTKKIGPNFSREMKATLVWLMETRQIKFDLLDQLREAKVQNFCQLLASLAPLVQGQPELYWVGSRLHAFLQTNLRDMRPLIECLTHLMEEDPALLDHLTHTSILLSLPYCTLWGRGLAQLFLPSLLARLWDKVIGGSVKVLVYALASAMYRCREKILSAETCEQVVQILTNMNEDRQEAVLTSALDLWEMDGCPLVPGGLMEAGPRSERDQHTLVTSDNKLSSRMSLEINVI